MSRRVSLPGADDLFRPTQPATSHEVAAETDGATSRAKHDQKMTVYLSSAELIDVEQARLALRQLTGRPVDRGRLVRAAVALALADFAEHGDDSALVAKLAQQ